MINCILNNLEMENQLAPLATLSVLRKHWFAGVFFHPYEYGCNVAVVYGVLTLRGQVLGALGGHAHFIILTAVKQARLSCLERCRAWKGGRRGLHGAEVRFEPGASRWSQD